MKCEVKGCKNEVLEFTGASGRALCPQHLHGTAGVKASPGTVKMRPAPENKMLPSADNKDFDELAALGQLTGVGQEVAEALAAGGFKTAAAVRAASDDELLLVSGIGEKRLALIREALG